MLPVPESGSVVEVTTKWRNPGFGVISGDEFITNTYYGTVTPRLKYYTPTEFGMETGDDKFPIRRIDMSRVERVEYTCGRPSAMLIAPVSRQVKGSKGNIYTVTNDNGKFSCTCSGFMFRHNCRHINEMRG